MWNPLLFSSFFPRFRRYPVRPKSGIATNSNVLISLSRAEICGDFTYSRKHVAQNLKGFKEKIRFV
jgi:hypothetical protein